MGVGIDCTATGAGVVVTGGSTAGIAVFVSISFDTVAPVVTGTGSDDNYVFGNGIHEMGTARMGRDPKTSILNGNNQKFFKNEKLCDRVLIS